MLIFLHFTYNTRFWVEFIVGILLVMLCAPLIYAHPGPLNPDGGHYEIKTRSYHYHKKVGPQSQSQSKSNSDSQASPSALKGIPQYRRIPVFSDPTFVRNSALVKRVIDGKTLIVTINGKEEKIRLLKINSPLPGTPEGDNCKAYLSKLILGKAVIIEHHNIWDDEGFLLCDILWNGVNVGSRIKDFVDNQY